MGAGKEGSVEVMTGGTMVVEGDECGDVVVGEGVLVTPGVQVEGAEATAGGGSVVEAALEVVLAADDGAWMFLAAAVEYDGVPEVGVVVEEAGPPATPARTVAACFSSSNLSLCRFRRSSCPSYKHKHTRPPNFKSRGIGVCMSRNWNNRIPGMYVFLFL